MIATNHALSNSWVCLYTKNGCFLSFACVALRKFAKSAHVKMMSSWRSYREFSRARANGDDAGTVLIFEWYPVGIISISFKANPPTTTPSSPSLQQQLQQQQQLHHNVFYYYLVRIRGLSFACRQSHLSRAARSQLSKSTTGYSRYVCKCSVRGYVSPTDCI